MEESERERLAWSNEAHDSSTINHSKRLQRPYGTGIETIQKLVPSVDNNTLIEKTAQSLAQAWSRDESLLPDFCRKSQTDMDIIFKVQGYGKHKKSIENP